MSQVTSITEEAAEFSQMVFSRKERFPDESLLSLICDQAKTLEIEIETVPDLLTPGLVDALKSEADKRNMFVAEDPSTTVYELF